MDETDTAIVAGEEARLRAGARYEAVRFEGLSLHGATLRDARFLDCVFIDCDLSMARLDAVTLRGVRFEACRLAGVDMGALRDDGLGIEATFDACDLDRVQIAHADLRACVFTGGRARGASLRRCDVRSVAFDGVDLTHATFLGCDLREADLRSARGYRIDPSSNRVSGMRVALPEALSFLVMLELELDG